jgi:hypothetical protein
MGVEEVLLGRCARPARGHGAGVDGLLGVGGDHGQDVAAVDPARTERFKMPDQRAITGTRFGKAMDTAKILISGTTAARGVWQKSASRRSKPDRLPGRGDGVGNEVGGLDHSPGWLQAKQRRRLRGAGPSHGD